MADKRVAQDQAVTGGALGALYGVAAGPANGVRTGRRSALPCRALREGASKVMRRSNDVRTIRALAGVVGIVLVLAAGVVLLRSSGKEPPSVLGVRTTQPSASAPAIEPIPSFVPPASFEPLPSETPSASPSAKGSTVPAAGCHNSYNPSCGPLSWTRSPGQNGSMRISVSGFTEEARVGETVTYVVTLTDSDAMPFAVYPSWGDGTGSTPPDCNHQPYGPWDPPARHGGTKSFTFKHAYGKTGHFRVVFTGRSGACGNPYSNELKSPPIDMTITPADSPAPSESPSPSQSPFPI